MGNRIVCSEIQDNGKSFVRARAFRLKMRLKLGYLQSKNILDVYLQHLINSTVLLKRL